MTRLCGLRSHQQDRLQRLQSGSERMSLRDQVECAFYTVSGRCGMLTDVEGVEHRRKSLEAKFHYAIWSQTGPKLVADLQRARL